MAVLGFTYLNISYILINKYLNSKLKNQWFIMLTYKPIDPFTKIQAIDFLWPMLCIH